jgi:glucan phosphoethanolaminetransferase (alkaline phosphatase superfamily)
MERPFGLTLIAAYFYVQALWGLANSIRLAKSGYPVSAAILAAACVAALAAGIGLAKMRKWGRTLAMALAVASAVAGLFLRLAGVPAPLAFTLTVVAGLILVYLTTHPCRFRFE